jgi:hypothetical protein
MLTRRRARVGDGSRRRLRGSRALARSAADLRRASALDAVHEAQEVGASGELRAGNARLPSKPRFAVRPQETLQALERLDPPPLVASGDPGLELEARLSRRRARERALRDDAPSRETVEVGYALLPRERRRNARRAAWGGVAGGGASGSAGKAAAVSAPRADGPVNASGGDFSAGIFPTPLGRPGRKAPRSGDSGDGGRLGGPRTHV